MSEENQNRNQLDDLIAAWLEGRISESDSVVLQAMLSSSDQARERFRQFVQFDAAMHQLAGGDIEPAGLNDLVLTRTVDVDASADIAPVYGTPDDGAPGDSMRAILSWSQIALAAAVLFLVTGLAYQMGRGRLAKTNSVDFARPDSAQQDEVDAEEQTIAGYATLRRVVDVEWLGQNRARVGDVIPAGTLAFKSGVAEIDFFCGATVIVEGPAELDLESDWSVRLVRGRMRAVVPPVARGFVVKAAETDIVDLGTEFAVDVGAESAQVKVVDGEIELRGGKFTSERLVTGDIETIRGTRANELADVPTIDELQTRHRNEQRTRLNEWKQASQELSADPRLIAYYPIRDERDDRRISNVASSEGQPASSGGQPASQLDGTLVGPVIRTDGRFGPESFGVNFQRPGARVRTLVKGTFQALTLACWVNVNNLEHRYNALFMGDGYENGEPHWQIRDDGRMMFSVMVDDTPGSGKGAQPDARFHRVYFTEPIWDSSMSGQWMHLAAVYDPNARRVRQFVNGKVVADETIEDEYFVSQFRIGPAEIGNWGQPFRNTPWFAVRNLNGTIDELAIFNAALAENEIQSLYQKGKPLGY